MSSIRIAVIADIHAARAGSPPTAWHDRFEPAKGVALAGAAVTELAGRDFDVAFVLGDIANNGDDASLDAALVPISELGAATWIVAGNHDLRASAGALARAVERAEGPLQIPGLAGVEVGDGFIVAGLSFEGACDDLVHLVTTPEPLAWSNEPVLLLSHYPIISRVNEAAAEGWKYAGDAQGLAGLANLLGARSALTIAFHGHLHLADAVARGSFLQLGFPALVENGHHIALVEISHDKKSTRVTITPVATSGDTRPAASVGTPATRWTFTGGVWTPA